MSGGPGTTVRTDAPDHPEWCTRNHHDEEWHEAQPLNVALRDFSVDVGLVLTQEDLNDPGDERIVFGPTLHMRVHDRENDEEIAFEVTEADVRQLIAMLDKGLRELEFFRFVARDREPVGDWPVRYTLGWRT